MTINITIPEPGPNLSPQITVFGVGGSGGNAVNNMMHSNLEGVDFLIANTDAQALQTSNCERKKYQKFLRRQLILLNAPQFDKSLRKTIFPF